MNDQNFGEVFCHLKTNLGAENKRLNTFKYLLSFGNLDDKLFSFVYRHNNKINIIWKKFGKGNFKILKGTIDIDVFDVFFTSKAKKRTTRRTKTSTGLKDWSAKTL